MKYKPSWVWKKSKYSEKHLHYHIMIHVTEFQIVPELRQLWPRQWVGGLRSSTVHAHV